MGYHRDFILYNINSLSIGKIVFQWLLKIPVVQGVVVTIGTNFPTTTGFLNYTFNVVWATKRATA